MRLAAVVVYMVAKENDRLLDLHLERIEKHTYAPYTIYGSVNRLLPQFRRKLESYPRARVFEFPPTEHRSAHEHSYYLERLVRIAIDEGATHVVTMHVDSFPVRDGWDAECASRLTEDCPVVTLEDEFTACLFFSREFYLGQSPRFLPSDEELESREFKEYLRVHAKYPHSGIGYLHAASASGRYAELTTPGNQLYDDLVFHFRGVLRDRVTPAAAGATHPVASRLSGSLHRLRRRLPRRLGWSLMRSFARGPIKGIEKRAKSAELERLLADFDEYLAELRSGE